MRLVLLALLHLVYLVDSAQVQVNRWPREGGWWPFNFGTAGSALPEDVQALVAGDEEARRAAKASSWPEGHAKRPSMIQKAQVQKTAEALVEPVRPHAATTAAVVSEFDEAPDSTPNAATEGVLAALFAEPRAAAEAATAEEQHRSGELRPSAPQRPPQAPVAKKRLAAPELAPPKGARAALAERCLELAAFASRGAPKGQATALFLSGCPPLAAGNDELCGALEPQLVSMELQKQWQPSEACNILLARLDQSGASVKSSAP